MLGAFLMGAMSMAFSQVPQFKDYPVKVYSGPSAKLVVDSDDIRLFKTRLSGALKEKPTFAGEYIVAAWGCGAGCVSFNFVNKRTGKVLKDGFGGEEGEMVEDYKPNSSLMVTSSTTYDSNYNPTGYFANFYILKNNKFQLIQKVKTKKPSDE